MTSRERMLIALNNGRPDRLPCQVHAWMHYYLNNYLGTMDWMEANDRFGFDHDIYTGPVYKYSDKDSANWKVSLKNIGTLEDGYFHWIENIETPDGTLSCHRSRNEFTQWEMEPFIKNWDDFKIWSKWRPIPVGIDFKNIMDAKDRLGDKGIIRVFPYYAGQGSPWQCMCILMGTEKAIFAAHDQPEIMHESLNILLQMALKPVELWKGMPGDMIETGGGAGSNTVISPKMFREFCLPYDTIQNKAFQSVGLKVVYHLCGGVMKHLDMVVESGANGLETMTPVSMGGDCDLKEASKRVGDKLFFIGGFDQNAGFEKGTPESARRLVFECFEATRDHAGYIIAPSDHFFFGNPENLTAFCNAAKECLY